MKLIPLISLVALLVSLCAVRADFALRDGDTVVFLGDSITAAREYSKVIENYTLLRFPERKVRFINAGKGGETAKGSLARLDKDVFGQGATLVTVAYGVNDIGWGFKADEAHKREYLEAIGEIVNRCQKRGVRVFICSAAITAENPKTAEQSFLQKMCDEGLVLAKAKGAGTIDVQRQMREVQRRVLAANEKQPDKARHTRMHVEDGVHLNDLGQMAMAFAILKGLGAPADVSAATIDARAAAVVSAEHCRVSEIRRAADGITFTRSDDRLPLNLAPLWMLHGFYIPFGDELNRYLLAVTNLAAGRYEAFAGGRSLGSWDAEALAQGVNIASATADPWQPGGPWDAQAHALKIFTDMRNDLASARRGMDQTLIEHPKLAALRGSTIAIEKSLVKLQRDIARPFPVTFVVRTAAPAKTSAPGPAAASATPARSSVPEAKPVPADVAFCREVLILHHSHVDVGYTHPQSMYWELQKGYLDAALDMLDRTEAWPDDLSRPRWTAEATAPVMRWLQTAPPQDVSRLEKHLRAGRFGISAFEYNTTPLSSAEGLARQLYPCRELRQKFGADIRTANQHDVNGIPWSAVDLLLDSHIELLTMAINLHLGGTPLPRPGVYRWQGPSGRELLVMNGEHYTMFDQWANPGSRDLDTMQEGIYKYLRHVKSLKYPYDFVYLTATCAPFMYDNSPPNQELPDLIRKWNEEGRQPRLRMVTPNELLDRLKRIPREEIPVVKGDWTDYWNFGSGSSAAETCLSRKLNANADAIDLLRTWNGTDAHVAAAVGRMWEDLHLYNEHTWGAYNTLEADNPFVLTLWQLKANPVYDGKPLSDVHLRRQLHQLAANPWQSWKSEGVLVFNPTGLAQDYFVPVTWKGEGKRIESHFLAAEREDTSRPLDSLLGPVRLEPYSWQVIPWTNLSPAAMSDGVRTNANSIETDYYRLTFEPTTGKVTGLLDKKLNRQVVASDSAWGFFQLVQERPQNNERSAFHVRNVEGERYGRTGWKPDWVATRTSYSGTVECRIERHARSATLVISAQAEGLTNLEQRITLHMDSPMIDLSARFLKLDVRSPEAVYFAFPLELPAEWRAHFDTAGIPTELDAEQIPGTCRDWVTVDTFASVYQNDFGVTLYCPDAPMVQIGNFNWARKQAAIPRQKNPLLLAWPLNNYWETNFRATQPGLIQVRYSFRSHGPFSPVRAVMEGQQTRNPPVTHLVLEDSAPRKGRFLDIQGENVVVSHVKPGDDGQGLIIRLVNLGEQVVDSQLSVPGRTIDGAWNCGALEDRQTELKLSGGSAICRLPPRQITTVRLMGEAPPHGRSAGP